jgi:hypothetical protein
MQIMVTDGGAHPADKWGEVTATEILNLIQIDPASLSHESTEARLAIGDLRPKLVRFFTEMHDKVQGAERQAASVDATSIDPIPHSSRGRDGFLDLLKDTPFAAHFAKPEVQHVVHRIIAQHVGNVMHIERRYHQDRKRA